MRIRNDYDEDDYGYYRPRPSRSRRGIERSREVRLWFNTVIKFVGAVVGADMLVRNTTGKGLVELGKEKIEEAKNYMFKSSKGREE